jgi:hypothetical protein
MFLLCKKPVVKADMFTSFFLRHKWRSSTFTEKSVLITEVGVSNFRRRIYSVEVESDDGNFASTFIKE